MIFKTTTNLMTIFTYFRSIILLFTALVFLSSCEALKYKPVDAKEFPPEPEKGSKKTLKKEKDLDFLEKMINKEETLISQVQTLSGEQV